LHWVIGDVVPPELRAALEIEDQSLIRECERLWYVACTRARKLLIVPELPQAKQKCWARIVNMEHNALPRLNLSGLTLAPPSINAEPPSVQTADHYIAERLDALRALSGARILLGAGAWANRGLRHRRSVMGADRPVPRHRT
jgi:CRISPR-associated exonuclease Cas4